ncbi:MAG: DUF4390 domain-containing protein [Methylococcaceae bacterium]|nr:DUF4390 domain-containing protein [Methylococcaceae bacterium]
MKVVFLLFCCLLSKAVGASEFSTEITNINIEQVADSYELNMDIDFNLSPIAKEALQKGIALAWAVKIKVQQDGVLWDSTLQEVELNYQIQNHALLNLYSVRDLNAGNKNMFSTLAGALDFISKVRSLLLIDKKLIEFDHRYHIAVKVMFEHESLPVPIRPFSYFDPQWGLSSRWTLWPLQK